MVVWLTHIAETIALFFEKLFIVFDDLSRKKERKLDSLIDAIVPSSVTANQLTVSRIIFGVLASLIALEYGYRNNVYLIVLLLLIFFSDFADGPIARSRNQLSMKGALLDRLADRISLMPLVIIEFYSDKLMITIGIVGTLVILLIALINYRRKNHREVPANVFGKLTEVVICIGVVLPVWPGWWDIGHVLGWIAIVLGAASLLISVYRWHYEVISSLDPKS